MATTGILEVIAIVVTHLSDDRARQRLALDEGNKTRVEQARLLLSVGHFDDNYTLRRVASIHAFSIKSRPPAERVGKRKLPVKGNALR